MDKKRQILLFISTYSQVVLARNQGIKHEQMDTDYWAAAAAR